MFAMSLEKRLTAAEERVAAMPAAAKDSVLGDFWRSASRQAQLATRAMIEFCMGRNRADVENAIGHDVEALAIFRREVDEFPS
jgi:hypothetical protein